MGIILEVSSCIFGGTLFMTDALRLIGRENGLPNDSNINVMIFSSIA
jgi:hypothetical protein